STPRTATSTWSKSSWWARSTLGACDPCRPKSKSPCFDRRGRTHDGIRIHVGDDLRHRGNGEGLWTPTNGARVRVARNRSTLGGEVWTATGCAPAKSTAENTCRRRRVSPWVAIPFWPH